jgi:hypothetical protein
MRVRATARLHPAFSRSTDRSDPPVSGTAARHCARANAGAARRSGPDPTAPPRRVAPHARPPFLPFLPLCRAAAEPFPPRSLPHSFSCLHSSPTPPLERPTLPTTSRARTTASDHQSPPSFAWIPAKHRRRPPLPGELLPEQPIPAVSCKSLAPSPLPSCRTSSRLARRHPRASLVLSGWTLPSARCRRADSRPATTPPPARA